MDFPIFDKVGGMERALGLLTRTPSKWVLDKWRTKRRLPFRVQVELIHECQRLGVSWEYPEDFEWRDEVAS